MLLQSNVHKCFVFLNNSVLNKYAGDVGFFYVVVLVWFGFFFLLSKKILLIALIFTRNH